MSRALEFVIVVTVAFGHFVYWSLLWVSQPAAPVSQASGAYASVIVLEIIVLISLGFFLRHRGWTREAMGLRFRRSDPAIAVLLTLACQASYLAVFAAVSALGVEHVATGHSFSPISGSELLFIILVNPFYEEIFLCGYVVSFFKRHGLPFWYAINTSVAIRVSYHLYQGMVGVMFIVPFGLILTFWFARTGRLWPVILCHAVFDAVGLMFYLR